MKSAVKHSPDWPIFDSWVFENLILDDESSAIPLRSLDICVLVNNNLWGKSVSLVVLPTTFDERFRVTSVPFFIPDFNLLSCESDNVTFKVLYWAILY